ncbi:protein DETOXIFICATION 24-like isoform X2 [Hibiscus syriacus]|uniref:protein DETOXIFICATION 24-like isoform X2 n=1 Tax=Hibiscus syriacus TaxID=106335 RepID=UPI0019229F8F|nr:protein DETOXIFICATION 24-like isoform X2 [Hibiscus syriacus]
MQPQCQCSELMFCIGFLGASIVRVANELGRGNAKALKFSIKTIMSTSVCIGMTFFVLCLVFWHQIAHLFTSTEQVVQVASTLSTFLAISMLFNSIQIVLGDKLYSNWGRIPEFGGNGEHGVLLWCESACWSCAWFCVEPSSYGTLDRIV